MKYQATNKKVSQRRGESWRKNLLVGKLNNAKYNSKLKDQRILKGLSQFQMSEILNISVASYGAIERKKSSIKKFLASYIANELATKLDKIFIENNGKYTSK